MSERDIMFRAMSIATLVMILVCLFLGASIALADESGMPANDNVPGGGQAADVYDFSDYFQEYATQQRPASGPVDSQAVEEPETLRFDTIDC